MIVNLKVGRAGAVITISGQSWPLISTCFDLPMCVCVCVCGTEQYGYDASVFELKKVNLTFMVLKVSS